MYENMRIIKRETVLPTQQITNNTFGELPTLKITKKKYLGDMEISSTELMASGLSSEESRNNIKFLIECNEYLEDDKK